MPNVTRSPLNQRDLDAIEVLARKANAYVTRYGRVPLYIALEVGDEQHRDGFLLLTWPAMDRRAEHSARLIFDYIADVVEDQFGAVMVPVSPEEETDVTV